MPTRTILIAPIAVLVAAGFSVLAPRTGAPVPALNDAPAFAATTPATASARAVQPAPDASARPSAAIPTGAILAPVVASATATLVIAGASFTIPVSSGESVLDAMQAVSSEGSFAFTSTEYPGLGTFIDSINGQKSAGGMNWMLYVNGVSASSGASSEIIHANDVIEWKYEK